MELVIVSAVIARLFSESISVNNLKNISSIECDILFSESLLFVNMALNLMVKSH